MQLGVITRKLPEIGKPAGRAGQRRLGGRRSPPAGTQDMTGFTLKIAALILSQFQEVAPGLLPFFLKGRIVL